jgi:hypothetical protein
MTEPGGPYTHEDLDRWATPHPSEPDVRDPHFCRCGLARTAHVHTDGDYQSMSLTEQVWRELRGGS